MSGKKNLVKDILLRPLVNPHKMHPTEMKIQTRMTKPLAPLKFKLQDLPETYESTLPPLGNTEHIPFHVQCK